MDYRSKHARRLLTSVDASGYGGSDEQRQFAIQSGLVDVLETAAFRAGLDRASWVRQEAGDGELAIVTEDEPRIIDDYVRELHAALVRHNRDLVPEAKLRLRLAIHFGVAMRAASGFAGKGVVVVSRLVDSDQLRNALRASGGELAVILSDQIYRDTVVQRHTMLAPEDLREVPVVNKEFQEPAWLYVPGHDVHSLDLGCSVELAISAPAPHPKPSPRSTPQQASMHAEFHAPVTAQSIGMHF